MSLQDAGTEVRVSVQARDCGPDVGGLPGVAGGWGDWIGWAGWDVHRANVFGRCEATSGIEPSGRLVPEETAAPCEWKFTRADRTKLMKRLADKPDDEAAARP